MTLNARRQERARSADARRALPDLGGRITAELAALTHQFLAAVSFEQGERPRYDAIRDLFLGEGLLIKNSADARRSPASTSSSSPANRWSTPAH
jgi:hypothetical protein